ncbi:MAG: ATP-binding cassette domain-containing protein [Bacteroidetes bacterium]|nr:ATP-binding cassette domain-containing protein [Bacteroidota bacterium]
MIEIINISKSFGDKKVLFDVSATFETGKTNLIIGASGQGKSVLGRCMVGLIEVDSGEISYDKRMLSDLDRDEKKKLRVDHIKPYVFFPELRLEDSNCRVLCRKCDFKYGFYYLRDRHLYTNIE